MMRQYYAPRGRLRAINGRTVMVGSIAAGAFVRIPGDRSGPWRVLRWLNREYAAARRGPDGKWQSIMIAGGHLAELENVADRRRQVIADHRLYRLDDDGYVQ